MPTSTDYVQSAILSMVAAKVQLAALLAAQTGTPQSLAAQKPSGKQSVALRNLVQDLHSMIDVLLDDTPSTAQD